MSTFNIKGKIALVTGANRGIGEGFVKVLLEKGANKIYAAARSLENLNSITALSPHVIEPVLLDVTKAEHIKALTSEIEALDILVNNAGIANACSATSENAVKVSRREMETNYFGPIQITLELLPLLKQSSHAAIINISSIAGISNFPALGPYSATKAAMHSYTQGLRAELKGTNIHVAGVYPGPIDTRMTEDMDVEKAKPEQVAERTFEALAKGMEYVLPDDFSEKMYAAFLEHPHNLEREFSEML